MTAQIDDMFRYRAGEFAVAGISEGDLFDISVLELQPVSTRTACWRGYQAVFAVADSHLVLDALHVNLVREGEGYERQQGPVINGITPSGPRDEHDFFNNHYDKLSYHLEYTGGVLLADGFLSDLYVHMGFHPAWKYETVIELIFQAGVLRAEHDRSERMGEVRREILASRSPKGSGRTPTRDEIAHFIERAFDRRYRI